MGAIRRRPLKPMEHFVTKFPDQLLGSPFKAFGHGAINPGYLKIIIHDGNQIRHGIKGPFPLLLGQDDLFFRNFSFGNVI